MRTLSFSAESPLPRKGTADRVKNVGGFPLLPNHFIRLLTAVMHTQQSNIHVQIQCNLPGEG